MCIRDRKSVMTRRPTFETPGRTAENPRSRGFSHSEPAAAGSVSYTHLDVYKRQELGGGMEEVIVGVVGVLQFEVLEYRLKNEYLSLIHI